MEPQNQYFREMKIEEDECDQSNNEKLNKCNKDE